MPMRLYQYNRGTSFIHLITQFSCKIQKNADFSVDFLVALALVLKLPERFSKLLFNCAGRSLNERNPRDMALKWILHNYWNKGISFANEYLATRGYKSLDY